VDLRAIADAIAARYVGVTVNGVGLQITPTALLPSGITRGPVLVVQPPSGTRDIEPGRRRADELDYSVLWLNDPADMPTRTALIYDWGNALYDKVLENYDLDLPYVAWAKPVSFRSAFDEDWSEFGWGKFDTIETVVRVHVNEIISTMAI
jgi:hypothetical protein